jgi:hypothetical protein
MQQALHRSSLVPRGFVVDSACYEDDKAVITVGVRKCRPVSMGAGLYANQACSFWKKATT